MVRGRGLVGRMIFREREHSIDSSWNGEIPKGAISNGSGLDVDACGGKGGLDFDASIPRTRRLAARLESRVYVVVPVFSL